MAAAETARLIASLELQDKNFTRGLKQADKRLGNIDKRLGAVSGAINRNVARGVDSLISHGIDAGQAVVQAAVDQESAIVGIAKTVDGNIDALVSDLKRLSTETGSTFTELAGIAEVGGAMGIAKDELAGFVEQVAILGATTNVGVEEGAAALGQLTTVLGLGGDELDNYVASLVDLGNKGNSTEAQILEIAKRTGAASKTIGIAKDETLAWASAVANLGIGEELGGTGLQKFFVDTQKIVARGGDDLAEIGKISGMTGKQFKQAFKKDATGALHSFIAGLKDLNAEQRVLAIESLFGKGNAMTRILLGLSEALDDPTSGLTASLETNKEAWREASAANEEAQKRFGSSEFVFKRLNNSVNLIAAAIGKELLPVLVDLAEEGLAFFSKPSTQTAVKNFAQGLGKGIRSLAKIVTSINWGAVVGFLQSAAGFAGQLVTWFGKMPDWAQAFLIGGFVATKLPVVGGLITELGKGLIKGVLGMTAGVVNLKAATVVGGGGPPIPGGGGGKGGFNKIPWTKILFGLTGVGLAASFASEFEDEIQGLSEELSTGWRGLVKDNFGIDIPTISPKDIEWPFGPKNTPTILPEIFGGNGLLGGTAPKPPRAPVPSASKPPPGIGGLGAPETGGKRLLTGLGNLTSSINTLEATISKPKPTPKDAGGAPGAFRPVVTAIGKSNEALSGIKTGLATQSSAQVAELGNIKNATATLKTDLSTKTAEQTAELATMKNSMATLKTDNSSQLTALGGIQTATTTLDANAGTRAAAQVTAAGSTTTAVTGTTTAVNALSTGQQANAAGMIAAQAATNMLSTIQSASQVLAITGTTNAVNAMSAQQRAVLIAQTAVNAAGNMLSVVQSASQVMAAAATTRAATAAGATAASASRSAGATAAAASSSGASRIVAAIWAARPIIQPTNVIEKYTTIVRTGGTSGSRNSGPLE